MSEFLNKINEKFNKEGFFNSHIVDMFFVFSDDNDDFARLISKYSNELENAKPLSINSKELDIVLRERDKKWNFYICIVIEYLIACSSISDQSNFYNLFIDFFDKYFSNIEKISDGLVTEWLLLFLSWTLMLFPDKKYTIKLKLCSEFKKGRKECFRYISLVHFLLESDSLRCILSPKEIDDIHLKYMLDDVDYAMIYFYLDIYKEYIEYLTNYNVIRVNYWKKKYCDFVLKYMDHLDYHELQILLPNIRDIMCKLQKYSDEDFLKLETLLESSNKKSDSNFIQINRSYPRGMQQKLKTIQSSNELKFEKNSNKDKIKILFNEPIALNLSLLVKCMEKEKKSPYAMFDTLYSNSKGEIVNYKPLNKSESFSLKCYENIINTVNLYFSLYIYPFFSNFELDGESRLYIYSLLSNNKLVNQNRLDYLKNQIEKFLTTDFENSVYNIVLEFEECLRYFLKNNKFYIKKKNKGNDFIGLGDILNFNENNKYRDFLMQWINPDQMFTLIWLLSDHYGFDLRNKIAHRNEEIYLYKNQLSIYAALEIINILFLFKD